ncbi:MEDS domain-containing protein [Streptomyces varsoviensis]|uniref:MEDS domain-containing protein n=1 Tax=Streptomyces varsoviensis TaxID=67373 RepID=UPI0009973D4E|nr:MEDS domain-containing protein [Streptomyces varsoviensis]
MAAWDTESTGVIPVQRMRPGDHAFVSYEDDEGPWGVLTAFAWTGLGRGEKVMLFPTPGLPESEVLDRLDAWGPAASAARRRGQIVLSSMRSLILPHRKFTPERQWEGITTETERAVREGYQGFRAYIDMHWVADLDADIETMLYRETHADHLFETAPYSEICAYDRRAFSGEVLDAMAAAHPRNLLERLGSLRVVHADDGVVRLTGDADLATRAEFTAALKAAMARTPVAGRLLVDLTDLNFLGVGCAADLLLVAERAEGGRRIEVRCDAFQARTLRRLGAGSNRRLAVAEAAGERLDRGVGGEPGDGPGEGLGEGSVQGRQR